MSYVNVVISDLREKRLWPVAAALLIALIAVPVLLSSHTKGTQVARVTPLSVPVTQLPAYPAVSVENSPRGSKLNGPARDPFVQPKLAAPANPATGVKPTSSTATPASVAKSSAGSNASGTGSSGSSGSSTPTTTTPGTGSLVYLSFSVDLVFRKAGAKSTTLRDVSRLTPVPSSANPFLVFLGVKSDHTTALFLVSSQARPSGQGKCMPSPRQCQFLELKERQREAFLVVGSNGHADVYTLLLSAIRLKATTASSAATPTQQAESSVAGVFGAAPMTMPPAIVAKQP